MKRTLIIISSVILVALVGALVLVLDIGRREDVRAVASFEECQAMGYPILESYPEQCMTPDGKTFVREIDGKEIVEDKSDIIRVVSPKPSEEVASPLTITGEARGPWYFEATFPVTLLDGNGATIAEWYAEAQGEWMTTGFVPFTAELTFTAPTTETGTLVLSKSNASGLPEHDDEVRIPIRFKGSTVVSTAACVVSGCSGEICSDTSMVSNCIYRPEFACYKRAACERQSDGQCGWTQTPELSTCLLSNRGQ